jgi:hypothetical protein
LVPVPIRVIAVGALLALLNTSMVPLVAPAAPGPKYTLKEKLWPAGRFIGKFGLVKRKAPLDEARPETITVALPVFDTVTLWAFVLLPTATLPMLKLDGLATMTPA